MISMDIPKIVVFVDGQATEFKDFMVTTLVKRDYAPMVDSLHSTSYDWFVQNVKPCPHRLFTIDKENEEVLFFVVDQLEPSTMFSPDLLIYFNEDFAFENISWVYLKHWLHHIFFDGMETEFVVKGEELMKKPYTEVKKLTDQENEGVDMKKTEEKYYSLRKEYVEEDDIMLYEVCKPFTDLPYTSVIRNFSLKGAKPFFPSLYICPSWGVSRHDLPFLKFIWAHEFGFDSNEFDMDLFLKEATEACYPQPGMIPELEPEVYRRSIEDVLITLQDRKNGVVCGSDKSHGFNQEFRERVRKMNEEIL
jgi:hypothetical protein